MHREIAVGEARELIEQAQDRLLVAGVLLGMSLGHFPERAHPQEREPHQCQQCGRCAKQADRQQGPSTTVDLGTRHDRSDRSITLEQRLRGGVEIGRGGCCGRQRLAAADNRSNFAPRLLEQLFRAR